MGQKVSPVGFRTGVTIGWKSRWYAPKSNYGEFLVEDAKIRKFLDDRLNRQPPFAAVSAIEIERTREEVKVIIKTARPGIVIGPKGAEVDNLKNALEDLTDRRVNINIVEVRNPDLNATLVAEGISEQLKRRASFRRTLKQRAEAAMQAGAKGVKIQVSGRLGGAEMCRTETTLLGSIPLHTLEADVDYGFVPCFTTYGAIGVKVWIYRGLFGEQVEEKPPAPARRGRRGGPGGGGRGGAPRGGRGGQRGRGGRGGRSAEKTESTEPTKSAPEASAPTSPGEGGGEQPSGGE
jgi:small subunit ribosomal protein S3